MSWNASLEQYFAETAEKAECQAWLHKQSEALYSHRKTFIDLPVIVGSGAIAFLSAGSTSMFAGQQQLASVTLGVASLLVSILNTIGSYFNWAKRAEGHRISSIHYAQLYRFVKIEMNLPRDERMKPTELLKYCKQSYDRLAEVSPIIPDLIATTFKFKFEKYTDISKPEEMNGLTKVIVYNELTSFSPPYNGSDNTSLRIRIPNLPERRASVPKSNPVQGGTDSKTSVASGTGRGDNESLRDDGGGLPQNNPLSPHPDVSRVGELQDDRRGTGREGATPHPLLDRE